MTVVRYVFETAGHNILNDYNQWISYSLLDSR